MARTQRLVEPRSIGRRVTGGTIFDTSTGCLSWFAHRMEPDEPPVDSTPFFQIWQDHHGDKGLQRAILSWETLTEQPPPPLGSRDSLGETIGMSCEACDLRVDLSAGYDLRPVRSRGEEARLLQGAIATHGSSDPGMVEYLRWRYAGLAALRASGCAETLTVFVEEQLAAAVTVVHCGEERRGQDFWTRPEFRRRGLCTALVGTAVRRDLSPLILGVMRGSEAERLYRRLGFETVSYGWELTRTVQDTGKTG